MSEKNSLAVTRFNNETWNENCSYREKNSIQGCIYGCPTPIATRVPLESLVFVIEMNNSENRVLGIGLLRNIARLDKYYKIYSIGNYNRYNYYGKYRLDRSDIETSNPLLLPALDYILFKEKSHMKRGLGITLVPESLLQHKKCEGFNIKMEIQQLFLEHFSQKDKNKIQ